MKYATSGTFPVERHEDALDNQMLVIQEQDVAMQDLSDRAIMVPAGQAAPRLNLAGLSNGDILEYHNGKLRRRDMLASAGMWAVWNSAGRLAAAAGSLPQGVPAMAQFIGSDDGATAQDAIAAAATPLDLVASTKAFVVGSTIRTADGFLYEVVAPDASDFDLETAGGARLLALPSTDGVVNLRALAPAADGVTDDAPRLRAAMAALVRNGGGTLYIPEGRYYLGTGDPRGFRFTAVTGSDDTWAVCEAGENVQVVGDGPKSVLLYESNRLGKQLGGTRGDAGALFSNLRVRENAHLSWYICPSFSVRNFSVEWTSLVDLGTDYIEGQAVRIWAPNNSAIVHGRCTSSDMTYINAPGHQIVSVTGAEATTAVRDTITNPGSHSSPAVLDHSCYYFRSKFAAVLECSCRGGGVSRNDAMIEIGAQTVFVRGNECEGMNTFMNAVSEINVNTGNDKQSFQINGNRADVRVFMADYSYSIGFGKGSVAVFDNDVTLLADSQFQNQYLYQHFNDSGDALAAVLPSKRVTISNNRVEVVDSYVGALTAQSTGVIGTIAAQRVSITGNKVRGARQGAVLMNIQHVKTLEIARNNFDGCRRIPAGSSLPVYNIIYLLAPPGTPLERLTIDDNPLVNHYVGAEQSHCLLLNVQDASQAFAPATSLHRNACSGAVTKDIGTILGSGVTLGADFILVDHSVH